MKKFFRYFVLSLVVLSVTLGFAANFTLGLVLGNMDNPYFVQMAEAAKEQAKLLGIDLIITNANYDSATQLAQVENLIQRKVNAIVINPTDSTALIPAAEKAYKAGIPFVCIDRTVDSDLITLDIESDNIMAGRLAAQHLAKRLNSKGKIAVIRGTIGLSVERERYQGFMDEIKKYPNIKVVAEQSGNFNMAEGMSAAEAILTANPDLDAIYAENDPMGIGAVQAIKSMIGRLKNKNIFVVAVDASPAAVELIKKDDYLVYSSGQQPRKMTALAVVAAYMYANGFKIQTPDGSKRYLLEVIPVSKENVDWWINTSVDGWH